MSTLEIKDLDNQAEMNADDMKKVRGGLSFGLQQQLNQLQHNLNVRGQILFNPAFQYNVIRSSQQAWRVMYGRQMPYFFPMPRW